jgi:hypothetical protein
MTEEYYCTMTRLTLLYYTRTTPTGNLTVISENAEGTRHEANEAGSQQLPSPIASSPLRLRLCLQSILLLLRNKLKRQRKEEKQIRISFSYFNSRA